MSKEDLRTYPLVLAWSEIHAHYLAQGLECEWISEKSREEQEEEYYRPLRKMMEVVRAQRDSRRAG